MAKVLNINSRVNQSQAASATRYWALGDTLIDAGVSVETDVQTTYRTPGTFSKMSVLIVANDRATSTLRLRVNGANGNQIISISGTGLFTDSTNTDTIAAGDEVCYQMVTGAGGTTFIPQVASIIFEATNKNITVKKFRAAGDVFSTASTTAYANLSGSSLWNTTEVNKQTKLKVSGVMRNFFVNVPGNARTSDTTYRTRVNGANGAFSVTVAAATTGFFEDTSSSDNVATNDLYGYSVTTGIGAGNINGSAAVEMETINKKFHIVTSPANTTTINLSVTTNFIMGGRTDQELTETEAQLDSQLSIKLSALQCYVVTNTLTADSSLRLRINAANATNLATIINSTTGWFEDSSNIDSVSITNDINYQLITGGSGTSVLISTISCLATVEDSKLLNLLGVGT